MKHVLRGLCAATTVMFTAVPAAVAAPATVTVRVEGPTRTLIETTVTTDARTFHFTGDPVEHECDSTTTGPPGSPPSPTRNVALMVAAEQTATPLLGSFGSFGASFTSIGGESVDFDPGTSRFLGEYENGQFATLGGCGDPVVTGDDVLYAYGDGNEKLLKLTGPAVAAPGVAVPVKVVDAGTGAAVAGATVAGTTTGADGAATVGPFTTRGPQSGVKASKPGTIRSNALALCVTDGADGFCGTTKPGAPASPLPPPAGTAAPATDLTPASGRITTVREKQVFARGKAPRTLGGTVAADPSGIRDVAIRLSKSVGARYYRYDARGERFVRLPKYGAAGGTFFSVGRAATWSYLLPSTLGPGRYVLDVKVTDGAGNVDGRLERGRSRIVFTVR